MNETNHPSSLATCTLIQDFLGMKDGGIYEAVVQLKQQLDAVVAEFSAFKSAHPQPFGPVMMQALDAHEKHQDDVPETGMLNAFFILRDSIAVETPNVTAALAEVEAKAIEKFAARQKEKSNAVALNGATHLESAHEFAALQALAYSVELREGRV
ncbi:hypothetical protein [Serratia fonticola]